MRNITTAAALLVAAATHASAGTLGTIPVGADRYVSGELDAPGPQKWTVSLRRGRYYAVTTYLADGAGNVSVHAAGGGTLVSAMMFGEDGWHGVGFAAPYTGWYTVQVACVDAGTQCPGRYDLAVAPDCHGDARTACRIAPGSATRGDLFGLEDVDWIATSLVAGRTYQIAAADSAQPSWTMNLCLAILDKDGRTLAGDRYCEVDALSFRAPASGTYFLALWPADFPATSAYSLSVK